MTLKNIDRNVYEKEVITSIQPTLFCFFKDTESHGETATVAEELSRQFESIQFYAAQEEEHEYFFGKFHFLGTPIFIFFVNGMERGRLMGTVSAERLRSFIESNTSEIRSQ